ncbi:MAG: hypothetical protein QF738_08160 [Rhodospirillales bacterium]|nr:hypothetical protein [Rhodospirillales bacterium]
MVFLRSGVSPPGTTINLGGKSAAANGASDSLRRCLDAFAHPPIANGFNTMLSGKYRISFYPGGSSSASKMGDRRHDVLNPRLRRWRGRRVVGMRECAVNVGHRGARDF